MTTCSETVYRHHPLSTFCSQGPLIKSENKYHYQPDKLSEGSKAINVTETVLWISSVNTSGNVTNLKYFRAWVHNTDIWVIITNNDGQYTIGGFFDKNRNRLTDIKTSRYMNCLLVKYKPTTLDPVYTVYPNRKVSLKIDIVAEETLPFRLPEVNLKNGIKFGLIASAILVKLILALFVIVFGYHIYVKPKLQGYICD